MSLVPSKSSSTAPSFRPQVEDEFTSFQREMNNLMSSFFNRGELSVPSYFETAIYPSIDLKEVGDKFLLDADVPGMSEADIDIDLHGNTLTIKGEKKSEKETRESDFICSERSRESFRRDINLGQEVDQANVKAELKDGVLHVELLKKEPNKSSHKKIAIRH